MDPRDINFPLRTGHDRVNNNTSGPVDWNNTLTLLALAMVFTEKATIDAGTYVTASGRRWVTPKDMQMALMHNALPRTNFYNQDNLYEKVELWRNRLMSNEVEDDDEFEETDSDEEDNEEEINEEWSRADTAADESVQRLITGMNSAQQEWETWVPTDHIGRIVHNAIERCLQQE
tara:strand:- start:210 stop:734 length:525 start_codon:yes stop_codon:yes gene_type:complete